MKKKSDIEAHYAVIFTSVLKNKTGYFEMAKILEEEVKKQPGFMGFDSARDEIGITVSYWKDLESIKKWRENLIHTTARIKGKQIWYKSYKTCVAKIIDEYAFESKN